MQLFQYLLLCAWVGGLGFFASDEKSAHSLCVEGYQRIKVIASAAHRFVRSNKHADKHKSDEKSGKRKEPRQKDQQQAHKFEGETQLDRSLSKVRYRNESYDEDDVARHKTDIDRKFPEYQPGYSSKRG